MVFPFPPFHLASQRPSCRLVLPTLDHYFSYIPCPKNRSKIIAAIFYSFETLVHWFFSHGNRQFNGISFFFIFSLGFDALPRSGMWIPFDEGTISQEFEISTSCIRVLMKTFLEFMTFAPFLTISRCHTRASATLIAAEENTMLLSTLGIISLR